MQRQQGPNIPAMIGDPGCQRGRPLDTRLTGGGLRPSHARMRRAEGRDGPAQGPAVRRRAVCRANAGPGVSAGRVACATSRWGARWRPGESPPRRASGTVWLPRPMPGTCVAGMWGTASANGPRCYGRGVPSPARGLRTVGVHRWRGSGPAVRRRRRGGEGPRPHQRLAGRQTMGSREGSGRGARWPGRRSLRSLSG